jgi:hypothetical protein
MTARFSYGNEVEERRKEGAECAMRENTFLELLFLMFVIRNPKARRTNKALLHSNFAQ